MHNFVKRNSKFPQWWEI